MTFIINFHGIGEAKRPYEEGEKPYWISVDSFRAILDLAAAQDMPIGLSFDDGNDSDYLYAVPELQKRGLSADFFVLAGKIDKTGYLSAQQIAAIDNDPLFAIGSHGMDHQPWPLQDDAALMREIAQSQAILSQICGRSIESAGLPFGRYDRRVMAALKKSGYKIVYSSDGGPRLRRAMPIPRFSVRNDTKIEALAQMISKWQSMAQVIKTEMRVSLKALR